MWLRMLGAKKMSIRFRSGYQIKNNALGVEVNRFVRGCFSSIRMANALDFFAGPEIRLMLSNISWHPLRAAFAKEDTHGKG